MSQYQYYEFKTIDKSLSKQDKDEIGTWSSRTYPTNTGAIFNYSYGSFPRDEFSVVEKYFDAMFNISNWGTTRLIFKFPKDLFEADRIKQYVIEDGVQIIEKPDCFLLCLEYSEEEGGRDWVEGEGWLSSLISLRDDILNGDYRALYLIWLKNAIEAADGDYRCVDKSDLEPPVPSQLDRLNGALQDLVEIFEISKYYLAAAIENLADEKMEDPLDLKAGIDKLSEDEKRDFLLRLIENEELLSLKLKKRVEALSAYKATATSGKNRRSIGEIAERIKEIKKEAKLQRQKQKEEERLKRLTELESHEAEHWRTVDFLVSQKNAKGYVEAVALLKKLKELAVHKNRYDDYRIKVEAIKKEYSRLSGFTRRIFDANLIRK